MIKMRSGVENLFAKRLNGFPLKTCGNDKPTKDEIRPGVEDLFTKTAE